MSHALQTGADLLTRLHAELTVMRRVVVAYSGGVDSSFLAAVAHDTLGSDSLAVTAVSPSLARRDRATARSIAIERGWNHREIATNEVDDPNYIRNAPDRCYWCKEELFTVLGPLATERDATLLVGTHADDLSDHRPGRRAAREHHVRAPLAELGFDKETIRAFSRTLGLPTAERPASPCLSSRVAYGVPVTPERLARIDAAEDAIRALGFQTLRVRDHGDLARIEVPAADIERLTTHHDEIALMLRELGFTYVTLDLVGFRSGALNEVLPLHGISQRPLPLETTPRA